MIKPVPFIFAALLVVLSSCQSLQPLAIDYLQPASISFPPEIRKIALLNNTCQHPRVQQAEHRKVPLPNRNYLDRTQSRAQGDASLTLETLAQAMAEQNYFDSIVICDSALRAREAWDTTPVKALSEPQVRRLAEELHVDLLVVLDDLPLYALRNLLQLPEYNCYQGQVKVVTQPTVSVYYPKRPRSSHQWQMTDSLYWENFGESAGEASLFLLPEKDMWEESADYTGFLLASYLVPTWEKAHRYLYTRGSVQLRDAAVYVHEQNWEEAFQLWQKVYEQSKSAYKRLKAAVNIAVYHEMNDRLPEALQWAEKAQALAVKTERKKFLHTLHSFFDEVPNTYFTQLYVEQLKERNAQLPVLNGQMKRFAEDF